MGGDRLEWGLDEDLRQARRALEGLVAFISRRLANHSGGPGAIPFEGSVGDCFDNAMCESFFVTLECELLDRQVFRTVEEARQSVFQFIEGWTVHIGDIWSINYASPIQFERVHALQINAPGLKVSAETR